VSRSKDDNTRICRVTSLTLANAMIFQQILADNDPQVQRLSQTVQGNNIAGNFDNVWTFILDNINYVPIFTIARNIVREVQGSPDVDEALRSLAAAAEDITKRRAALRHDLMGRIYHRLIADAKYFGAYYTTVPAAALLLKLTLESPDINIDWTNVDEIRKLTIADLACGTGTLLKATLQTIIDNHVRTCVAEGKKPNLTGVHQALVEKGLWGFDVVEFSIHLAAAALAIHEPKVEFREMNLYTLKLGGSPKPRLGSIELFSTNQATVQADLFGGITGSERVTGKGGLLEKINLPRLDLCVMNPPFVRSVGGNLLFGNLPTSQRTRMQTALKQMVKKDGIRANVTAGLGSVFTALGDRYLRPGGHISLVLPRALLSGVAWEKTRILIGEKYCLRYIITRNEPTGWAFSENSNYSECMLVARKLRSGELQSDEATKVVNLWKMPASSIEALTYTQEIEDSPGVPLEKSTGVAPLWIGDNKVGEVILCPSNRVRKGLWRFETAFSQTDLCRAAFFLTKGELYIPNKAIIGKIPTVPLLKLGSLGPDRRDIHDGFQEDSTSTAYRAFWGHDTSVVQAMAQSPNTGLSPLAAALPGRNLRDPILLWKRSGRVLIAERLWLITTRVVSIRMNEQVLSNTWWTLKVYDTDEIAAEDIEKVLTLWLNSTLGLLSLIAARVDTRAAWVELKKPILKEVVVLNPIALSSSQRQKLIQTYDELSSQTLARLPDVNQDIVRRKIDKAIMETLKVDDDLTTLRRMLGEEPILKAR
jgi:hypothetical protein